MIEQLLQQIVDIEEHCIKTNKDYYRLVSVPECLYGDILDLKTKFENQFGIFINEYQSHAANAFSYEIDLTWKPETVKLTAIKAYINFQRSRRSFQNLETK